MGDGTPAEAGPLPAGESARGRPAAALRPFIAWYAGYRQSGPPASHRGLPSPYLTLIFTLDEPLTLVQHPDPGQPPGSYDTLVGGLHTRPGADHARRPPVRHPAHAEPAGSPGPAPSPGR
jgi:hypothetical protein